MSDVPPPFPVLACPTLLKHPPQSTPASRPPPTWSTHLPPPQIDPTKKGQVIGPGGRIINLIRETSKVGGTEGGWENERMGGRERG